MSFTLNIECSRDIEKLSIDFTDGTSTVTHTQPKSTSKKKKVSQPDESVKIKPAKINRRDQLLNLDEDYSDVSDEVVELPNIDLGERSVSVADELQNFDF